MHDLLFENQLHLKAKNLRRYAEAAELDLERYDYERGDHVYLQVYKSISTAGPRAECDRLLLSLSTALSTTCRSGLSICNGL